jgi:hypothetical protein
MYIDEIFACVKHLEMMSFQAYIEIYSEWVSETTTDF